MSLNRLTNRKRLLTSGSIESEVPFSTAEYKDRLLRLQVRMDRAGIDLLFVSAPESLCYLSGFQAEWYQGQSPINTYPASGIAVHVSADDYIHFDDEFEYPLIKCTSASRDVRIRYNDDSVDILDFIIAELRGEGWLTGTVGLEMWSSRPNRRYSEMFEEALRLAGCDVVDATLMVRETRRSKSPQELVYVRTAQRIADIGIKAATAAIAPGVAELDVYAEMVYAMAKAGGEAPGIVQPVVSGPKSVCGHGLASRRRIMPGDIVNVDICGVYNRYHANIARAFSVGEPHPEISAWIRKVSGAMHVVADTIKP